VPTYQYACTACGNQLEAVQSFSDEPLTECPACAGRLRKVFSTVGVVFKGSGFYRTDSRSANGADKADKGKDAPAKETAAKDSSSSKESGSSSTKESGSSSTKESGSGSSSGSSTSAKPNKAPAPAP
jgi:putative FmdB family regulatory protein